MELTVHGPLRGVTGSKTVSLSAVDGEESVHGVLERFVEQYPRAERQLFDESGTLRGSVRVLVDGERVDPDSECPPTAAVSLIPAAQGG
jgi:molybdopterin converting factor small subunit